MKSKRKGALGFLCPVFLFFCSSLTILALWDLDSGHCYYRRPWRFCSSLLVLAFLLFWSACLRFCYCRLLCYYLRLWQFCLSLRVLAFMLLLVALLVVLLVFAGAGILVIVGHTAGGFAVAGVSSIACVSSGSVRLSGCWHSCYCWSHYWRFCCCQNDCYCLRL
jgi:hypothetical protein